MNPAALIACTVAAAGMLAFSPLVFGHGDAAWVMKGGYRDNGGILCCNETDCGRAQPGEIRRIDGGWEHVPTRTRLMDGDPGIHRSIDADTWRCVPNGRMNCLFISVGI